MFQQIKINLLRHSNGSSILEFVIVFPVFFLFFLGLVDLSRYWTSTLVLQYGLNEGSRLAAKITDFEYNIVPEDESTDETLEQELRFLKSRELVIEQALQFPLGNIIDRNNLTNFYFDGIENGVKTPKIFGVAVLRPGEKVWYAGTSIAYDYNEEWDGAAVPDGFPQITLMRNYPIALYAEYHFRWFLPFMNDSVIKVRSLSFREKVWDGTVPEEFNPPQKPTRTATVTATSSFTATSTFTPVPPTVTPTHTNTPTVTIPTSTPTITFTPSITYTPSITNTPTITFTPSITNTRTPTRTPSLTRTPTSTRTATSTRTQTFTPSTTYTPSITNTSTATVPSSTPTATPVDTATFTPLPTNTSSPVPTRRGDD